MKVITVRRGKVKLNTPRHLGKHQPAQSLGKGDYSGLWGVRFDFSIALQ